MEISDSSEAESGFQNECIDDEPDEDDILHVDSPVSLRKTTSKIASAGSGIVAEGTIEANQEIFRVDESLLCIVYVEFILQRRLAYTRVILL